MFRTVLMMQKKDVHFLFKENDSFYLKRS